LLAGTSVAGDPNSHFHASSLHGWLDDHNLKETDFASKQEARRAILKAAVARGKGDTDIFGCRMQRGSFDFFVQQLEVLWPGLKSDADRIEAAFGSTFYIHLSRPDRLGQAISRVRAEQTGLWHRNSDGSEIERIAPPQEARYDAQASKHHMAELAAFDHDWEQWFEREGLTPLRLNYASLSKDPQGVLAQVLSALNLDPTQAHRVETPTAKLADASSREWRDRFEDESQPWRRGTRAKHKSRQLLRVLQRPLGPAKRTDVRSPPCRFNLRRHRAHIPLAPVQRGPYTPALGIPPRGWPMWHAKLRLQRLEIEMPKMKTKSAAKKRFSFTATGRVKAGVAGKRHGMIKRSTKFIRDASGTMLLNPSDAKIVKKYMPYDR